jgi:hypothetical protein
VYSAAFVPVARWGIYLLVCVGGFRSAALFCFRCLYFFLQVGTGRVGRMYEDVVMGERVRFISLRTSMNEQFRRVRFW